MTLEGIVGQGASKRFSRLAIDRLILRPPHKLWYNSTTVPEQLANG